MNNLEAIWWETQDIDVNKNRIGNPTLHVHFIRKNEEGILSTAMMLRYSFNLENEAKDIENAVVKVLEEGYRKVEKDLWNN